MYMSLQVEMKFAALVSLDVLQSMADLTTTKSEDHQRAIQALDIITRSMSSMRYTGIQCTYAHTE